MADIKVDLKESNTVNVTLSGSQSVKTNLCGRGLTGDSAYETAVKLGYVGTEEEWIASLKGEKGDTGEQGEQGIQGETGPQGPVGPAGAIKITIVETKPTTGEEGVIYLVKKTSTETQNIYDEYMWINGEWELIGSRMLDIDMSQYYTKDETNEIKTTIEAEIPTKVSQLSNDSNYVKNTDYASSSTGGVIKIQNSNGVYLSSTGVMYPYVRSYTDYQTQGDGYFISKGTLENWLVGKDLTTKAYVDEKLGNIETALDTILGE